MSYLDWAIRQIPKQRKLRTLNRQKVDAWVDKVCSFSPAVSLLFGLGLIASSVSSTESTSLIRSNWVFDLGFGWYLHGKGIGLAWAGGGARGWHTWRPLRALEEARDPD